MKYDADIHHRNSIRLKGFDYSSNGLYFITICTQNRAELFGEIAVGADSISAQMKLNYCGEMIERIWKGTIKEYTNILSEEFIIMPNHFHCILGILRADMESAPTVGTIIQAFKRHTTIEYINGVKSGIYSPFDKRIWQRNYYEHIIRDKKEYQKIWEYIDTNPAKWVEDCYYGNG